MMAAPQKATILAEVVLVAMAVRMMTRVLMAPSSPP